jgi:hypothetical protein
MGYKKFCYWVDPEGLRKVGENIKEKGGKLDDETRIPCRALRTSRDVAYLAPPAWYGFCRRRTSWYWKSEKVGKYLIVSNSPFDDLKVENSIIVAESDFKPDRLPSPDEIAQLVKSQEYQRRKPKVWENIEPIEKDFYQTWFERRRANEPFDFNKIFASHSANHSNFIDPKFFVTENGVISPYSIADSLRVCSSCMEFFNILGEQWPIKYIIPCIGAVLFAHLPMNQYFEVKTLGAVNSGGRVSAF